MGPSTIRESTDVERETHDRSHSRFVLTAFDRSDWNGRSWWCNRWITASRTMAARWPAGVVRAKSKITTMTRSIDYSAPRTDTRIPAYRGMLFPRSDTKYITARRTTWTGRALELETWVIKVLKDNWPVSKEIRDRGTYWEKCRCIEQNSK